MWNATEKIKAKDIWQKVPSYNVPVLWEYNELWDF